MRNRLALASGLAVALIASPAGALEDHPVFVVPGYIHSFMGGHSPASGNGVELTINVGTETSGSRAAVQIGAIGQLESLSGESGRSTRWALGAQGSILGLGVELAYAKRGADDTHSVTHGLHFAPFLSFGVISVAYRWTTPIRRDEYTHGNDNGFVLALKIPLPLRGSVRDLVELPFSRGGPITFGN